MAATSRQGKPGTSAPVADPTDDLDDDTLDEDIDTDEDMEGLFNDEIGGAIAEALSEEEDEDDEPADDELDLEAGEPIDGAEGDEQPAAEGDARPEGTGTKDGEQPRDETGKFIKSDEGTPVADATKTEAKPGAAGAQPAAVEWKPLGVVVDKENVAIGEARVMQSGDFTYFAVPNKDAARFTARISRGVVGERMWGQLQAGIKEIQAMREQPPRKSDAEIEAEMILEAVKPFLGEFLDEKDMKLLEANIKLAQRETADKYATDQAERTAKATETPWEERQERGIAGVIAKLAQQFPEVRGLTAEELQELYTSRLQPVRDSLYWLKDGKLFANEKYLYDVLRDAAERKQAKGSTGTASAKPAPSASSETPATAGHSETTAAGDKPKTGAAAADRFNRGVDHAAAPRTTSVKANRDARPPHRTTRDNGTSTNRQGPRRTRRERAEDDYRKQSHAYMASDGFDFNDGSDDDE